jgi:uncharacterized membrane protein
VKNKLRYNWSLLASSLQILLITLLVIGVFFRFANLDHKLYWHDEVYTTLRSAGFLTTDIEQEIFRNQIITPENLQRFQRLKPGSTAADTIKSLAIGDPQHPPFYFLLTRLWMQIFGSSVTVFRSLAALFSLFSLPLMYALGLELFTSSLAALLATVLLALSPFDILFSQIARQYSLLTCTVIGSSFLLLRALRLPTRLNWRLYTLAIVLGLYTHVFFGLTLIAQGGYAILLGLTNPRDNKIRNTSREKQLLTLEEKTHYSRFYQLKNFFLSIILALTIYIPWLVILVANSQQALGATSWSSASENILVLLRFWILSFTSLFLDLDFGFDSLWTYLLRLPICLLIAVAIYTVFRRTSSKTWLFILTSTFIPFLILAIPDLLLGGKRSAVTRYLISSFPSIQLAVGYFLSTIIPSRKLIGRSIFALLITGSIASCTVSFLSNTWWSNVPSYFNAEIAQRINANPSPLLVSDQGNDGTNLGDLISLSYLLNSDVRLLLLSKPPDLTLLPTPANAFVFRPSESLKKTLEKKSGELKLVFAPGQLWKFKRF